MGESVGEAVRIEGDVTLTLEKGSINLDKRNKWGSKTYQVGFLGGPHPFTDVLPEGTAGHDAT